MENINYILYICFLIPMLLSLFIMENKSRLVVSFILIGTTVCLFAAKINTELYEMINGDFTYYCTTISPIVEELLKALPILFYALVFSDNRQKLAQSAFALGLGFAIMENMSMLTQSIGYEEISITWAVIRGLGAGLMHSVCTVTVGIGISFVKKKKKLFYTGTFALLMLAITYHAIYNSLVMSNYQYLGIILPLNTYIPLLYFYRKQTNKLTITK